MRDIRASLINCTLVGDYSWLVDQPALTISRQIEMLNLFVGWEQANKYSVKVNSGQVRLPFFKHLCSWLK